MTIKMASPVCAAVATLFFAATSQADFINSFEGGVDGWVGLEGATVSSSTDTPAAVTDGAAALKIENLPGPGWKQVADSDISIISELPLYDTIDIDIYVPSLPSWAQAELVVLSATAGFTELGFSDLVVGANHLQATYDPSIFGASDTWGKVEIVINSDGAAAPIPVIYLDNLRLSNAIPEPAGALLAGFAVLGAVQARRRSQSV